MIVFLCEERSMTETLRVLLNRRFPDRLEGLDWQLISFQGKADLEKQFPRKMKGWSHFEPHFIILRDNDGGDCHTLKQRLTAKASESERPFHIRLVCEELEAWFLGDLHAVETAFPKSKATALQEKKKFRNPDKLSHASRLLKELTGISGKVSTAQMISPHLSIDTNNNRSHSFQVFWRTVGELLA